jgi:hypothetical protein
MIARILCTSLFIAFTFSQTSFPQNVNCPKIRVGVKITEVFPEVFDHLNKTHNTEKHRAVWLTELSELLLKSLRENSPDLDFIYLAANPNADYDYLFTSLIALSGGGERVVVRDAYTVIDGEDIFEIPPVYGSEYNVFKVWSSLIVNSNCFPSRRYILWVDHGESQDIYRAILSSLFGFSSSLTRMLYERENLRPVPPRDPNIETWIDEEYLSPLDEETRKVRIYEKVLSCNWQPSYYVGYHSQPVRFPVKTDRGKIKPVENCLLEYSNSEIQYILVNKQGNAVGEYTLLKGLDPLVEKITLSTCPLGNKPNIEKEVEIIIRGLELEVEPDRNTIYVGEKTSIQIDLHELDPDGTEILSCEGREVDVQVTGVVDGTISHESGKITLDEGGVAFIEYEAGENDKKIRITASFTPPGYPEEVTGEAVITVKKTDGDFNGTIMYERQVHWKDESEDPSGKAFTSVDLVENATIHVAARYLRTVSDSYGVYELYEAKPLTGNFSVTMKKTVILTHKNGHWTKNVDTWQGDEMMKPESGSNILLTIEPQKKSYRLQFEVYFPAIKGTTEITSSRGVNMVMEAANDWRCTANFEVDGSSDGNIVTGHWSRPAIGNVTVSPISGQYPGTAWNWSISRANKRK